MPKIACLDLMLEVTRRCNMKCCHCLRGDAEDLDMPHEIIKNLFAEIRSADIITFSGGEPSLAVPVMRDALQECVRNNIDVREVYIVTNGLVVSDEFIQICRDWDAYCLTRQLPPVDSDRYTGGYEARRLLKGILGNEGGERMGCMVSLSLDTYHDDIPFGNLIRLAAMPHLLLDKAHEERDEYGWVLYEGRAAFNGIGDPDMKSKMPWTYGEAGREIDLEVNDDDDAYAEQLYVNAEGGLLKDCNFSYETQEDYILGHVDGPGWADRFIEAHKDED